MTSELKVSIASFGTRRYPTLAAFGKHVGGLASEARAAGSTVLLLPELTCIGLLWIDPEAAQIDNKAVASFYRRVLTPMLGDYCRILSEIAAREQVAIVGASFWHEEEGIGRNSAFVFRPDGATLRQDKMHMTRAERAIATEGGHDIMTFDLDGVTCGLFVCYDVQYPEVTQYLVRKGVEVLFVPSLTDARGTWRVWHSAHARALENQLYVCVSTLVGPLEIPVDYQTTASGRAFVACPIDNRFKIEDGTYAVGKEGEDLLSSTLNLETLRVSRERAEVRQIRDRRPALYESFAAKG
ncbi:putative amidohydrolase [Paraburkholderia sp. BL27I4N3]|uniref:nitrilase-related carbon-nitrogen hydrolase n=1 Tax=Paraburkholderia sp. BL27I4N3 TaxID=1938805 RepID=UPI000E228A18|nr:nitrilase-related carbon-nitrogen hydrolase [Paraburkholderia sp. BL27I4N3]REE18157.1 putative amidohydrolase [Paraburkholderia sp. BL27I4N3]